ncbi:MAG: ATP-binding protein [Methylomonas sp.]|nr:ATP-binding protein [Methylomonas sp.]
MPERFSADFSPPLADSGPESPAFEREVLDELIYLHAGVLMRMPWVQLLLATGVVLLVYRTVPAACWGAWAVLTVGAEYLRARHAGKILKQDTLDSPESAHRLLILLAAGVGATVGLGALLFMPHISLPNQALLVIILFAMPAAGVSVAVSSPQILAAYSLLILVPTALSWALRYPEQILTVAGLTTLYWWFIISVAGDGEQLLRRSVAIRRQRDRMLRDLERRNAEVRAAVAKAEQSSQTRARVLAAASHDLRQPLHALSVYSAVLVANPAADSLPEVARNIDKLVRNLGGLLHGLLDLSRLSADQYVPDLQRISLDRLAAEVCNEYEVQVRDKQLALIRNLQHVRLHDDAVAIGRILRNLLDNAIKYTDSGQVTVTTYSSGDRAVLTVEDTGKGIPEDEQGRIFEEFYQLDNPGRDQGRGVGLGLAIVQRLCELIGAEISLTSRAGVGSQFKLTFRSLAVAAACRPAIPVDDEACLRGKRIYIVDDEADILRAMSLLLSSWQVRVETAASSSHVNLLFEQAGKPDLLIVDLRLGDGEQGVGMASRLQQAHGDFPVLVVTGETSPDAVRLVAGEGYRLLQKPIIADELYATLCSALGV